MILAMAWPGKDANALRARFNRLHDGAMTVDRATDGRTRRHLLTRAAGVAGTAALAPLIITSRTIAQARTLYVNSWGGSWTKAQDEAFYKPFTAATGILVKPVAPVSFAKLKAQVQTGSYEWDVTAINEPEWLRADRQGLAEPIDWTVVDRTKIPEGAVFANGIALSALATNLCYRTDRFPNGAPRSWADFWDVDKFPGQRALYNSASRTLIFALLADGVARDRLFPLDIERAYRKLEQIKPHIKVWWTQGNQSQQLLRDGEVDMMPIWNARCSELQQEGIPVEFVWDGAVSYRTMWGVAKGAPNRRIAWEFIQFCSQAKPQAEWATRLYYGPSNPDAFALIPPEIARQLPTYPDHVRVRAEQDADWLADHADAMEERFTRWLAS